MHIKPIKTLSCLLFFLFYLQIYGIGQGEVFAATDQVSNILSPFKQPVEPSKAYSTIDTSVVQNFPLLSEITGKAPQDIPVYGLFT